MKYRNGFVTNSSSTNFIIISKEEITVEYLFEKLGFKKGSPLENAGWMLCNNILSYPENDSLNYEEIKRDFGSATAKYWQKMNKKGYCSLRNRTSNSEDPLTNYFTMDSFEIKEKDFYVNGKNCIW